MMSACDRGSRWDLALLLFAKAPQVDAVLRSTALSSCASGALWRRAAELLEAADNVVAYTAAMEVFYKAEQWQRALALYKSFPEQRLSHNVFSHSGSAIS